VTTRGKASSKEKKRVRFEAELAAIKTTGEPLTIRNKARGGNLKPAQLNTKKGPNNKGKKGPRTRQ